MSGRVAAWPMASSIPRRRCGGPSQPSPRSCPQPDCVVVTGDLTDCGLPEEYEIVRDCLAALSMPVFVIPGNHDRRENLAAVLRARHPYLPAVRIPALRDSRTSRFG